MDNVYTLRLGTSNSYLISGQEGYLLIDAGDFGHSTIIKHTIAELPLSSKVKLAVLTHVHPDHVGNLREIKDLTGCQIAVHLLESELLHGRGRRDHQEAPKSKMIATIRKVLFPHGSVDDFLVPDVEVLDCFDLSQFGFRGVILHTPGHTPGSVSVVLEDGRAFVGDLAINYSLFGQGPVFPPFATDPEQVMFSWQKLVNWGVKTVYPGHGEPFDVNLLKRDYPNLKRTTKKG